jgi:diguanylate cyclase (GGDEF)-like protein/PAS domain S-box-containing protein
MRRLVSRVANALSDRGYREGNLRLDTALNNISQGLCFFDGAQRLIICNRRYIDMYDLPPERVRPGVTLREIVDLRFEAGSFPAMSREEYLAWRNSIVVADKPSDTTVELQNGRIFAIHHRPMPDGGWVATHEDITEEKKREASFRLLFDSNPVPMWLMDLQTFKFMAVNDAAVAHYGYSRDAFMGMTAPDLRFPADRHDFDSFLRDGGRSDGLKVWRHRKADGTGILVSVYSGHLPYNGRETRLCAVVDVTESKRAEEQLLAQKVQMDTAVNNMLHGLLMFDAQERLVLCNQRYIEMYRLSPEIVKPGCTLRELVNHRKDVGTFSGDPEQYCRELLEQIGKGEISTWLFELPDGRTVQGVNRRMPDGSWVATHEDITERKQAQARIAQESNQHRRLFETSLDLILVTDTQGTIIRVSPISTATLGYAPEEMIGYSAAKFVYPADLEGTRREMQQARQGQHMRNFETRYVHKDGRVIALAWSGVWSEPEQMHFFTGRDITERKLVEEKLTHLAHYDQLTGLPNRTSLRNHLDALISASSNAARRSTSIALFDLDGFKDVNDTLGHSIGDQLLQEVGRRMSAMVLGGAQVYRLGGDEFVLTLPGCGDPREIAELVDSILKRLGEGFDINGHRLFIGASAGIVIAPEHGVTVDDLVSNADLALYDAKAAGGRGYRLFLPVLRARAQARRELHTELRRACAENEFVLYYQPQIRIRDGAVVGAEALLRWRHPTQGILGPGAFIEELAENPVVLDVGRWILHTACDRAAVWRANGLPQLRIGVNLFPRQFHGGTLLADVETALQRSGLPAEALEIEITENIALAHDEATLAALRTLRAAGVNLAFDDFGTGYASLSYLARYPLSRIKIDQSFVRKIAANPSREDTAIVRSIIVMAHNLGLEVIAEGVETAAQAVHVISAALLWPHSQQGGRGSRTTGWRRPPSIRAQGRKNARKHDDRQDHRRQRPVVDEWPDQLAEDGDHRVHGKASIRERRANATEASPTARNRAANTTIARSAPGHPTRRRLLAFAMRTAGGVIG